MTPERLKELRWQSANGQCSPDVSELVKELASVELRLDDARTKLAEALEVLREVEWRGGLSADGGLCPSCPSDNIKEHTASCRLAKVLK